MKFRAIIKIIEEDGWFLAAMPGELQSPGIRVTMFRQAR